jgi:RNA polymerase sigma-70 factor (ECF subfamily)
MNSEAEFIRLIEQYDAAIRRVAAVYAGADGEGDDLYQEILLQLWRSFPSIRNESKPGTWLYRVALNTALSWQRRNARRARILGGRQQNTEQRRGGGDGSAQSQKQILSDFLDLLGGPDRWVLFLYMEGLKYEEIADITGLSQSAVGVRIHRLKDLFTQRYLES